MSKFINIKIRDTYNVISYIVFLIKLFYFLIFIVLFSSFIEVQLTKVAYN